MTEQEWLASREVGEMLFFVDRSLTERRRRLFAAACCRRIWHRMQDDRCRAAVELAERHADEPVSEEELENASEEADDANGEDPGAWAASYACCPAPLTFMRLVEVTGPAAGACGSEEGRERETAAQASLLRDLVGNPFRPAVFDPAWRRPDVQRIAQAIYAERAFDHLPILADALDDAGCTDEAILSHLRSPGPHVRGCWALDGILDKR